MMSRRGNTIVRILILIVLIVSTVTTIHACSSTSETSTRENTPVYETTIAAIITTTTTATSTISTSINSATTTMTSTTTTITSTTTTMTSTTTTTTSTTTTTTTTATMISTNQIVCNGKPDWIDDGYCDDGNNNEECEWDGGDCCDNANFQFCSACLCLDPSKNGSNSCQLFKKHSKYEIS